MLKDYAFGIIAARENHPGKTLAELYNPESMPDDLKKAHEENDFAIEKIYRARPFANDEERLEFLFRLYDSGPFVVVFFHAECFLCKSMLPTMPQKYFQSVLKGALR